MLPDLLPDPTTRPPTLPGFGMPTPRSHRRRRRSRSPSRNPSRNPSPPGDGGTRDGGRRDQHGDQRDAPSASVADLNAVLSRWVLSAATLQERSAEALERASQVQPPVRQLFEKVRVPKFDGTRAWTVFEAQFASAATNYGWSEAEKGRRLLSSVTRKSAGQCVSNSQ